MMCCLFSAVFNCQFYISILALIEFSYAERLTKITVLYTSQSYSWIYCQSSFMVLRKKGYSGSAPIWNQTRNLWVTTRVQFPPCCTELPTTFVVIWNYGLMTAFLFCNTIFCQNLVKECRKAYGISIYIDTKAVCKRYATSYKRLKLAQESSEAVKLKTELLSILCFCIIEPRKHNHHNCRYYNELSHQIKATFIF